MHGGTQRWRGPSRGRSYLVLLVFLGCTIDDYESCQPIPEGGDICITPGPERFEIDCGMDFTCDHQSRRCVGVRLLAPCDDGQCFDESLACIEGRCYVAGGAGFPCAADGDCLPEFECSGTCLRRTECVDDGDCVIGDICEDAVCIEGTRVECETDEDCPAGSECTDGSCVVPPLLCENGTECGDRTVCIDRTCVLCTADEQCNPGRECGRNARCVDAMRMDAPCTMDDDCAGYCDDDGYCTNGERMVVCDRSTVCPDGTVCITDAPSGTAPTEGVCSPPNDTDCTWDPWLGRPSVGCTDQLCVPRGDSISEDEEAAWIACAADPTNCAGADGRCRAFGSQDTGACLDDEVCATGNCVTLDDPRSVVDRPGFDCGSGTCVWLLGSVGGCLEAGRAAVGDACGEDGECMERTICDGATCRATNTMDVGERCRGSEERNLEDRCAFGLLCMTDLLCHAVGTATLGMPCTVRDDCAEDLGCEGDVCVALAGVGQPCRPNRPCAADSWCVPETNVCATGTKSDLGESCETLQCGAGLFCDATLTCARAAMPGMACLPTLPCVGGWECDTGLCRPL